MKITIHNTFISPQLKGILKRPEHSLIELKSINNHNSKSLIEKSKTRISNDLISDSDSQSDSSFQNFGHLSKNDIVNSLDNTSIDKTAYLDGEFNQDENKKIINKNLKNNKSKIKNPKLEPNNNEKNIEKQINFINNKFDMKNYFESLNRTNNFFLSSHQKLKNKIIQNNSASPLEDSINYLNMNMRKKETLNKKKQKNKLKKNKNHLSFVNNNNICINILDDLNNHHEIKDFILEALSPIKSYKSPTKAFRDCPENNMHNLSIFKLVNDFHNNMDENKNTNNNDDSIIIFKTDENDNIHILNTNNNKLNVNYSNLNISENRSFGKYSCSKFENKMAIKNTTTINNSNINSSKDRDEFFTYKNINETFNCIDPIKNQDSKNYKKKKKFALKKNNDLLKGRNEKLLKNIEDKLNILNEEIKKAIKDEKEILLNIDQEFLSNQERKLNDKKEEDNFNFDIIKNLNLDDESNFVVDYSKNKSPKYITKSGIFNKKRNGNCNIPQDENKFEAEDEHVISLKNEIIAHSEKSSHEQSNYIIKNNHADDSKGNIQNLKNNLNNISEENVDKTHKIDKPNLEKSPESKQKNKINKINININNNYYQSGDNDKTIYVPIENTSPFQKIIIQNPQTSNNMTSPQAYFNLNFNQPSNYNFNQNFNSSSNRAHLDPLYQNYGYNMNMNKNNLNFSTNNFFNEPNYPQSQYNRNCNTNNMDNYPFNQQFCSPQPNRFNFSLNNNYNCNSHLFPNNSFCWNNINMLKQGNKFQNQNFSEKNLCYPNNCNQNNVMLSPQYNNFRNKNIVDQQNLFFTKGNNEILNNFSNLKDLQYKNNFNLVGKNESIKNECKNESVNKQDRKNNFLHDREKDNLFTSPKTRDIPIKKKNMKHKIRNQSHNFDSKYVDLILQDLDDPELDIEYIFNILKEQNGCRYIQRKIDENCQNLIFLKNFFRILLNNIKIYEVYINQFGNYVIQKFLEFLYNNKEAMDLFFDNIYQNVFYFCINQYGTRIIQKALDLFKTDYSLIETEKTNKIFQNLISMNILNLIRDSNGNHVFMKILNIFSNLPVMDNEVLRNQFIYDEIYKNTIEICKLKQGGNVMQKAIECANKPQKVKKISQKILLLFLNHF